MSINKLKALNKGNPVNSSGKDVADSVNALIDGVEGLEQFKDNLAADQITTDSGNTVQEVLDSNSGITISEVAPTDPVEGDEWINCNTLDNYKWYVDVSGGQWVSIGKASQGKLQEVQAANVRFASGESLEAFKLETDTYIDNNNASTILTTSGETVQERLDAIPSEVDAAGTAQGLVDEHNSDAEAHPELTAFITSEADRAETAADVATVNGNVYETTTAGLAATVDSDYFSVVSADTNGYLDLYKNESGVAAYKKTYPSIEKITELESYVNSLGLYISSEGDGGFKIIDKFGNVALSVNGDGSVESGYLSIIAGGSTGSLAIVDKLNNLAFEVNELGEVTHSNTTYSTLGNTKGFAIVDERGRKALDISELGTVSLFDADIADVSFTKNDNYDRELVVVDRNNNKSLEITNSGKVRLFDADIADVSITESDEFTSEMLVMDSNNRVAIEIRKDGSVSIPGLEHQNELSENIMLTLNKLTTPKEMNLPPLSDLSQLLMYGQSLSVGVGGDPALSTTPLPNDYMFNYGAYSNIGSETPEHYPLLNYKEGVNDRETPQYSIITTIRALCDREDGGKELSFLMAGAGKGSSSIEELSSGTDNFNRLKDTVLNGIDVAERDSKGVSFAGMFWVQGENSLTNPDSIDYANKLLKLRLDVEEIRKFNQSYTLPMISYQTSPATNKLGDNVWGVPNAQLLASDLDPAIFIACPTYFMQFSDDVHLTNEGYQLLGAYLGKAWKRVMIDGEKWQPMRPTAISYSGNTVDIALHVPNEGVVIETGDTSAGFRLKDYNGYANITSVTLINDNTIRVAADRTLESPLQVSYARMHDGLVRDTATDHEYTNINGVDVPLHNYLIAFMQEI